MEKREVRICEVTENKEQYLPLLLIADEEEEMIFKYLPHGRLFVLDDAGVKAAAVICCGDGECEIKNIAALPEYQGRGYGTMLMEHVEGVCARDGIKKIIVGTGDSGQTYRFYEKNGYRISHVVKDFFTDHYVTPIVENGKVLKDMVYFQKEL